MNIKRKILLLLAAALCLSLCACGAKNEPLSLPDAEIWCVTGDHIAYSLSELAEEYNNSVGSKAKIKVMGFSNEDELAEAFEEKRPELLLCELRRAEDLSERSALYPLDAVTDTFCYADYVTESGSFVGKSFFPLGADFQVLIRNRKLMPDAPESFSALCDAAEESTGTFFGTDDVAALFNCLLVSHGEELSTNEDNLKSPTYVEFYNAVAEMVFSSAMTLDTAELQAKVQKGELSVAVVYSSAISWNNVNGIVLSPVPSANGEESFAVAKMPGLAVTGEDEEKLQSAAHFVQWLLDGDRLSDFAYDCGLISPAAQDSANEKSPLAELKTALNVVLEINCESYLENKAAFEASFAEAMELLIAK